MQGYSSSFWGCLNWIIRLWSAAILLSKFASEVYVNYSFIQSTAINIMFVYCIYEMQLCFRNITVRINYKPWYTHSLLADSLKPSLLDIKLNLLWACIIFWSIDTPPGYLDTVHNASIHAWWIQRCPFFHIQYNGQTIALIFWDGSFVIWFTEEFWVFIVLL